MANTVGNGHNYHVPYRLVTVQHQYGVTAFTLRDAKE